MRAVTLRLSLTASLLLLVGLLSAAILVVTVLASRRIADDLSARYLGETERSVEEQLRGFFAPVVDAVGYARSWSGRGVIDPRDHDASVAVLLPFLRAHPQVSSIATGDEGGLSWRLGAEGDGYLERVVTAADPAAPARFRVFAPDGRLLRSYEEPNKFDPRTRPWYADARRELERAGSAAAASTVWSPPFLLNTSKLPGIAAAVPFADATGGVYMVTFNVMLEKVSAFTSALRPTPHGSAMVLSEAGDVVGFPATEAFARSEARIELIKSLNPPPPPGAKAREERLPRPEELRSPLLAAVAAPFREGVPSGARSTRSLEVGGETWRLAFRPFPLGPGLRLWTVVMIPEDDFLSEVRAQRRQVLVVSGAALLLAVLLALLLAKAYARPLRQLAAESDRITTLDLAGGAPVTSHLVEVQRLADAQERMRGALDSFARYVPTPVVRELLRQGEAARLGGQVRTITVMFSDVRDFTTIAERLSADALTRHLAEYFERLMDVVAEHGGAVDKMIGDAIMSLWGAPAPLEDHAARAVRAALASRDWLAGFERRCAAEGRPALRTGFGLATGEAFVGNVGAPARLNYTALGDRVNLASRLEGASKLYGAQIVCDEATKAAAGPGLLWRTLDLLAVKGKHEPVRIFEPLGVADALPSAERGFAEVWESAFASYRERRFGEALAELAFLRRERPDDAGVRRLIDLCERFRAEPPPAGWDGVARLSTK